MEKENKKSDKPATLASYEGKDGKTVDFNKRVKLIATDEALFHKPGDTFEAGEVLANKMIADGHAKLAKE